MKRIYILLLLLVCIVPAKAQSGSGDYEFSVTNNQSVEYKSEFYGYDIYHIQHVIIQFNDSTIAIIIKRSPTGWIFNDASISGWNIVSKNSDQIVISVGKKATVNDYNGGFMLTLYYKNGSEQNDIILNVSYTQKYGFSNPPVDDRVDFKFY